MGNPIRIFIRTLTDPAVYRQIVLQPFNTSLRYFFLVYAFAALGISLLFMLTIFPVISQSLTDIDRTVTTHFPPAATLTIQNGTLSVSGANEPIIIPSPDATAAGKLQNLLVINTAVAAQDIASQSTLLLATQHTFAVHPGQDDTPPAMTNWPATTEPLTFTGAELIQNVAHWEGLVNRNRLLISLLVPLVIFLALVLSRILFVAFYTMPIVLFGLLTRRPFRYTRLIGVGLHTIVIADLIHLIAIQLYRSPLPYFLVLAYLGITGIILLTLPPKPQL